MPEQQALIPEIVIEDNRDALGRINRGLPNGGNGKPQGAVSRPGKYRVLEKLARSHSIEILETIIAEAKAGNMLAAKFVMDRVWPAPRMGAVTIDMPRTESPADLLRAMHDIWERMMNGELTPDEGNQLTETLKHMVQAYAIEPIAAAGQAAQAIGSTNMRGELAERLIRQIRMRQAGSVNGEIEGPQSETGQDVA